MCVTQAPYPPAESVEDQDRELEDMRRELEEVREAIAAERAAQDDIIRSSRESSTHLHRLRSGVGSGAGGAAGERTGIGSETGVGDSLGSGGVDIHMHGTSRDGRKGAMGHDAEYATTSIDDMFEPSSPPSFRGDRVAQHVPHDSYERGGLGNALRGGGGGVRGGTSGGARGRGGDDVRSTSDRGGGVEYRSSREQAGSRTSNARPRSSNAGRPRPMY